VERLINTFWLPPVGPLALLGRATVRLRVIVIDAVDGFSTWDVSTTNVGAVLPVEICAMPEAVIGPFRHSLRRNDMSAIGESGHHATI
jgi:hypothetical protein